MERGADVSRSMTKDHAVQVYPVPSSLQSSTARQYLSSYIINDTVALDAGALSFGLSHSQQQKIKHILLSHSHLDHVASLPIFLDGNYDGTGDCPTIYATASVLDCLQTDLFNNRLWPDFIAISKNIPPYLRLQEIQPRRTFEVDGVRITPIPVNHVVECMGFVVDDGESAVLFSSDTGPTEELWKVAGTLPNLKGVFMEVTFPNDMARLADIAKHLTPSLAVQEARKLPPNTRILVVHIHSRHRTEVETELANLGLPNLEIATFGEVYEL